jgi:anti-anti-sigma factor
MVPQGFPLLGLFLLNLGVAVAFLLKEATLRRFDKLNIIFSIWVFTICAYYATLVVNTMNLDYQVLIGAHRVLSLGIFFIPAMFVCFVLSFMNERFKPITYAVLFGPGIILTICLLLDSMGVSLWINTVRLAPYGKSVLYHMGMYLAFAVYFLAYAFYGAFQIIRHLFRTTVALYHWSWKLLLFGSHPGDAGLHRGILPGYHSGNLLHLLLSHNSSDDIIHGFRHGIPSGSGGILDKEMSMEMTLVPQDDIYYIRLAGEIVEPECRDLPDRASELLGEVPQPVLLDFSQVTYINSAGLGACVATFKRTREHDQELALCCLSDDVLKIFKLTRLTAILQVFSTSEEAKAFLLPT